MIFIFMGSENSKQCTSNNIDIRKRIENMNFVKNVQPTTTDSTINMTSVFSNSSISMSSIAPFMMNGGNRKNKKSSLPIDRPYRKRYLDNPLIGGGCGCSGGDNLDIVGGSEQNSISIYSDTSDTDFGNTEETEEKQPKKLMFGGGNDTESSEKKTTTTTATTTDEKPKTQPKKTQTKKPTDKPTEPQAEETEEEDEDVDDEEDEDSSEDDSEDDSSEDEESDDETEDKQSGGNSSNSEYYKSPVEYIINKRFAYSDHDNFSGSGSGNSAYKRFRNHQ